jgi:hypothetical protein
MSSVYRLVIDYVDGGGQYAANVLHFDCDDVAGADEFTTASDLASTAQSNFQASILACLSTDCMIIAFTAERVTAPGGPASYAASGSMGIGPTTMGSGSVGAQIKWIPAAPTAPPGRMTLPSPPSTWIIKDKLVSAYATFAFTLAGLLAAPFVGSLTTNNYTLGVYSRATHTISHVAHALINLKIGVQRRRLKRTRT